MDFMTYTPALWLLLLVPLVLVFRFSLINRGKLVKGTAFIMRTLGIILLVAALCRPFMEWFSDKSHVIFMVDISESVDLQAVKEAIPKIRKQINSLKTGDSYSFFYFANSLKKGDIDSFEKNIDNWISGISDDQFRKESRIASSLLTARIAFPADKAKRIELYSDGMETHDDLEEALKVLKRDNIDLSFSKLANLDVPEASVTSIKPNTESAYYGEKIRLSVKLAANRNMKGKLRFLNRGVVISEIEVELFADKPTEVEKDFVVTDGIDNIWQAELIPEKDHFPVNNLASCSVNIRGRAKVLAIHTKPTKLSKFSRALKKQGIELEYRGRFGLPENISEMLEFDAILLANIPATSLSPRQMQALKSYVMDFGGGLIMTGSENSFGLGGYYKTPVEDVLPVVSRYEKEKEQPSLSMVLVIDKSGSMNGAPIALARQAAKATVELLSQRDHLAVVAFDGKPYTVCEMTSAANAPSIQAAIDTIGAGGGTNMYPAMYLGKELLESSHTKIKHMIVLTDGQSMPGDFEGLATEMADLSMTVSTVALGGGAAKELLNRIAEIGRGRYYETMDADTVPRIFTKETMEASKSAIKEEPFTPIKIGDADYIQGVDFNEAPFLLGYVMTRVKPTARVQLLTETGDPLLASGRFGLGKSIAFTSGVTERWASEWIEWKMFGKLWSQVIRAVLRKEDVTGIKTNLTVSGKKAKLIIKRQDQANQPLNSIKWKPELLEQHGRKTELNLKEIGIGLYETEFKVPEDGMYTIKLNDTTNNKLKTIKCFTECPKEYQLFSKPPKALIDLSRKDNTSELKSVKMDSYIPIRNAFCIIAMVLLIIGIVLRRV